MLHRTWPLAVLAAVFVGGCGSDDDYANEPRPPAPINVTAAISNQRVSVSPAEFGAGPVVVIVSNQSATAQRLTIKGAGISQSTAPIAPRDTATLKLDVKQGSYELAAEDAGIKPADVEVGEERPSAQDELLQP